MDPITRVRMHGGHFYDIAGVPDRHFVHRLNGTADFVETIHGQRVWINGAYVVSVEDLACQPQMLAYAWESATKTIEYQHGKGKES